MGNGKKKKGLNSKPQLFIDIYEQMVADETKSFWDLVPVENTLIGRTVSHVIFRSAGVDIAKYFRDKLKQGEEMPELSENQKPVDCAEMEFLMAWNNIHQSFATLQVEALSFRALIESRDYQLWLVQTLAKIPVTQWEKLKRKFTVQCGNPAYIVAYVAWRDVLLGRKLDSKFNWLPEGLSVLEKYIISRTVRGYELEEEIQEQVKTLQKSAEKHGYLVMKLTQERVSRLFSSSYVEPGYVEFDLTEAGLSYYSHAGVLWGLWALAATELAKDVSPDGEFKDTILAGFANSLVHGMDTDIFGRLRTSFLADFSRRGNLAEEVENQNNSQLDKALQENERLKSELKQANDKVAEAQKELLKQKEKYAALESNKEKLSKQVTELEAKLKATEKKLAKALEANNVPAPTLVEPIVSVKTLEKRVNTLENVLHIANERINDLYMLLSAGDEDEDNTSEDTYEVVENIEEGFEEAVKSFKGRIIINGGAKTWQERVRKWFEDHGIKVRTYDLGDDASGVKVTDTVLMNVIQNKHKYSVKFMNEVRSIGAKLLICNVNNVEQTLRIVFDGPDRK